MGVSEAEKSDGENEKMNGNAHGKRVRSCFVRIGMCRALRRARSLPILGATSTQTLHWGCPSLHRNRS